MVKETAPYDGDQFSQGRYEHHMQLQYNVFRQVTIMHAIQACTLILSSPLVRATGLESKVYNIPIQWQQWTTTALLTNCFLHQILQLDTEFPIVCLLAYVCTQLQDSHVWYCSHLPLSQPYNSKRRQGRMSQLSGTILKSCPRTPEVTLIFTTDELSTFAKNT